MNTNIVIAFGANTVLVRANVTCTFSTHILYVHTSTITLLCGSYYISDVSIRKIGNQNSENCSVITCCCCYYYYYYLQWHSQICFRAWGSSAPPKLKLAPSPPTSLSPSIAGGAVTNEKHLMSGNLDPKLTADRVPITPSTSRLYRLK